MLLFIFQSYRRYKSFGSASFGCVDRALSTLRELSPLGRLKIYIQKTSSWPVLGCIKIELCTSVSCLIVFWSVFRILRDYSTSFQIFVISSEHLYFCFHNAPQVRQISREEAEFGNISSKCFRHNLCPSSLFSEVCMSFFWSNSTIWLFSVLFFIFISSSSHTRSLSRIQKFGEETRKKGMLTQWASEMTMFNVLVIWEEKCWTSQRTVG